jgi:hypothetical protein
MGVEIGIDFFEHAISDGRTNDQLNLHLVEARKWIQSLGDGEVIPNFQVNDLNYEAGQIGQSLRGNADVIDNALTELREMLTAVERTVAAEDTGDHERVRRSNNRMRNALVKLAGYCREIPVGILRRIDPNRLHPYQELVRHSEPGQMDWQWKHLITVIERSVNGNELSS